MCVMKTLHKIDDKARFENAFHAVKKCLEQFHYLAPNIPRAMNEIVQHIYGRYDNALYHIFKVSNTYDYETKLKSLHEAHECLFFQQSSFESLISGHGCTVGQANLVIDSTKEAYTQLDKWYNALINNKSK